MNTIVDDFEEAVLAYAGDLVGVDVVITRNIRDFRHAPIKVLDPVERISALSE